MAIKTKAELLLFINQFIKTNNNGNITADVLNSLFTDLVDNLYKTTDKIGEIKIWASNIIPEGWVICNGQSFSKVLKSDLYNVLGDVYTIDENNINFNIPNLIFINNDNSDDSADDEIVGIIDNPIDIIDLPTETENETTINYIIYIGL